MKEKTLFRDQLAKDRTSLANERTLLAYSRTALGLVGVAVLVYKFGDPVVGMVAGCLSLAGALVVMLLGIRSYRSVTSRVSGHYRAEEDLEFVQAD